MAQPDADVDLDRRAYAEVLATVSHDIRAPLGVILGAVAELLGPSLGPLSEEQRALVQLVRRSGEKLGRLAANVLLLNRIASAKMELRRMRADLRAIVARAVETFERAGELTRLRVDTAYADSAVDVDVDVERATHAVINVLANAIRFARGEVRVGVAVAGPRGVVIIEDDGPGLRADQAMMLFDRDARVQSSDSSSPIRGLGLVVVGAITKAHGADATVETIVDDTGAARGARATLAWPRAEG
jgi:signal transduction histidine kinase